MRYLLRHSGIFADIELQNISNGTCQLRVTFSDNVPLLSGPIQKVASELRVKDIAVVDSGLNIRVGSVDPMVVAGMVKEFLDNLDFEIKPFKEWLETFRKTLRAEKEEKFYY